MSEQSKASMASLTTLVTILTIFFTVSGGLWHLGYWSTFDFNFLEYANYTDLFKSSLYPLFQSTWIEFAIMPIAFGLTYFVSSIQYFKNKKKFGKGIDFEINPLASDAAKLYADIIIAICSLLSGFLILFADIMDNIAILPISISFGLAFLSIRLRIFDGLITNHLYKIIVITLLLIFPTFNFFNGKRISLSIKNGNHANIVTALNSTDKTLNKILVGKPLLGETSEYMFFYLGEKARKTWLDYDVLVLKKNVVASYVLTNTNHYSGAIFYRTDYYDSIPVQFYVDSVINSPYNPRIWDSLIKVGLIKIVSKDTGGKIPDRL